MTKPFKLSVLAGLLTVAWGCVSPANPAVAAPKAPAKGADIISGKFEMSEVSGAAMLGDDLLIAADDLNDDAVGQVGLIKDPLKKLDEGGLIKSEKFSGLEALGPDDLEDAAARDDKVVYLTTSHSLTKQPTDPTKSPKDKPERKNLIRLTKDSAKVYAKLRDSVKDVPGIGEALAKSTKVAPTATGFNIEGLAMTKEGDLLFGLRSPTIDHQAVVLRLKNPEDLFTNPDAKA
ncbi:MAG: DUF3616 domain-containing protein, partial [bacterium]